MRRDRVEYIEDGFRGRGKFNERPLTTDWGSRDHHHQGRERQPLPPPTLLPPQLPPAHNSWLVRERSRSPIGGSFPPKDYHRDLYLERGRDDRRGGGRERIGGAY